MKGDFSRDTFDPDKHFSRVLMQQGRVQLDADWNEQASILLHYLQTLAADLIGPHGGPTENLGFAIMTDTSLTNDFLIGAGRYYVDGILCELDPAELPATAQDNKGVQLGDLIVDGRQLDKRDWVEIIEKGLRAQISSIDEPKGQVTLDRAHACGVNDVIHVRRLLTYKTQRNSPKEVLPTAGDDYLVYLDVWERHITYVEDDSIREVALGGPDTATRAKVVWQVKVAPNKKPESAINIKGMTTEGLRKHLSDLGVEVRPGIGRLRARAQQKAGESTDPCTISPEARYRGAENQLYRVEIHTAGQAGTATFKWSRDNGSVILPIHHLADSIGTIGQGPDSRLSLKADDWVEVIDDHLELKEHCGLLAQVDKIIPTAISTEVEVTLKPPTGVKLPPYTKEDRSTKHPLLRRWDYTVGGQAEDRPKPAEDGALLVEENKWLTLENGVQIWFEPASKDKSQHFYRTGDYWLIPARTATGDVEWPRKTDDKGNSIPEALPPHGVQHHYAPLWIITVEAQGNVVAAPDNECRRKFHLLAE